MQTCRSTPYGASSGVHLCPRAKQSCNQLSSFGSKKIFETLHKCSLKVPMYGTYVGMKLLSQRSGLKDSESTKSVCGSLADSQTNVVLVQNEGVLGTVIQHLLVLKASWAVDCVHQIFAVAAQKCDLDYRTNLIRFRVLSSSYKRRAPICMYIYIEREREG